MKKWLGACLIAVGLLASGCGLGGPGLPSFPGSGADFQLAPPYRAASIQSGPELSRAPSLSYRRQGGFALVYDSQRRGDKHLYFTTSPDAERWSAPVGIVRGEFSDQDPVLWEDPQGSLHLLFASNRSRSWQLYYSRSEDGASWSAPRALTSDREQARRPAVLADGPEWLIAYETISGSCKVMSSQTLGERWSEPLSLGVQGGDPAIARQGEWPVLVIEYGGKLMGLARVNGQWSPPMAIATSGAARQAALSSDKQGGLWLAYSVEVSEDRWQVAHTRGKVQEWGVEQILTQGQDDHGHPSIIVTEPGKAWFAWGISRLTVEQAIGLALPGKD